MFRHLALRHRMLVVIHLLWATESTKPIAHFVHGLFRALPVPARVKLLVVLCLRFANRPHPHQIQLLRLNKQSQQRRLQTHQVLLRCQPQPKQLPVTSFRQGAENHHYLHTQLTPT